LGQDEWLKVESSGADLKPGPEGKNHGVQGKNLIG
jgi:hypothetical protein